MARQSPTNPRFRCNECKDYYSAPEHKVHYQCASHGYLCEQHLVLKGDSVQKELVPSSYAKVPDKYIGYCFLIREGAAGKSFEETGRLGYSTLEIVFCLKTPVRYNWHEDVSRWIEEGREEEEKAKLKPKAKSKTKPDYLKEINVLVDLLEDDTLTKEVFIKKIRDKLK